MNYERPTGVSWAAWISLALALMTLPLMALCLGYVTGPVAMLLAGIVLFQWMFRDASHGSGLVAALSVLISAGTMIAFTLAVGGAAAVATQPEYAMSRYCNGERICRFDEEPCAEPDVCRAEAEERVERADSLHERRHEALHNEYLAYEELVRAERLLERTPPAVGDGPLTHERESWERELDAVARRHRHAVRRHISDGDHREAAKTLARWQAHFAGGDMNAWRFEAESAVTSFVGTGLWPADIPQPR